MYLVFIFDIVWQWTQSRFMLIDNSSVIIYFDAKHISIIPKHDSCKYFVKEIWTLRCFVC